MGKVYDQAYKINICKRMVDSKEIVPAVAREIGNSENTILAIVYFILQKIFKTE